VIKSGSERFCNVAPKQGRTGSKIKQQLEQTKPRERGTVGGFDFIVFQGRGSNDSLLMLAKRAGIVPGTLNPARSNCLFKGA
jgi:hypothetical protein